MKLSRLEITAFLGIRYIAIDIDRPILLIAGPNRAGKSSIADSLRFLLTGNPERVSLKKDLPALLHNGAKVGTVACTLDGQDYTRDVKSGVLNGPPLSVPPALEYCLRAESFAKLKPDERKRFLFDLMGVEMSATAVGKELVARGHDAEMVEEIMPFLRAPE